jgi:hypothetical protein
MWLGFMRNVTASDTPWRWWASRRVYYNVTLLAAAPASAILLFLIWWLFETRLPCLEITGFSLVFGALLFGVALALANCLYYLGPLSEVLLKPRAVTPFRKGLFLTGTVFSVLLIFLPVIGNLVAAAAYPAGAERCIQHGPNH